MNITQIADFKNDNRLITPKGALEDVLRAIDEGRVKPDALMILCLQTTDNDGGDEAYDIKTFSSNLQLSEAVALLDVAKAEALATLTGSGQ